MPAATSSAYTLHKNADEDYYHKQQDEHKNPENDTAACLTGQIFRTVAYVISVALTVKLPDHLVCNTGCYRIICTVLNSNSLARSVAAVRTKGHAVRNNNI